MGNFLFILSKSPLQHESFDTLVSLAESAIKREHKIKIFLFLDGVYVPNRFQTFPDLSELPKDKLKRLIDMGAQVIACGICVNARGLKDGADYIEGVKIGGLADLSEWIEGSDKVISL